MKTTRLRTLAATVAAAALLALGTACSGPGAKPANTATSGESTASPSVKPPTSGKTAAAAPAAGVKQVHSDDAARAADLLGNPSVTTLACGHLVHYERPREYLKAVTDLTKRAKVGQ